MAIPRPISLNQSAPERAALRDQNNGATAALADRRATAALPPPLPADRLERVEAWGMNTSVLAYVYRPSTAEGIREVFEIARRHGRKVGLRGAGRSYGDASLLAENICLDLTRMNRILAWNPATGIIKAEPGVTIRQLWQYVIGDGWWPPVVSGTMFVSLGGAASMNIHGKNNFKAGPIGNHILEFELLLPTGEIKVCSRQQNSDLFHAAIGGFGMLGCFVSITLQLKKVYSGLLQIHAFSTRNFADIFREFEARMDRADYLVGWIDCFARGKALGRGLVHQANYLQPGEDLNPAQTLRVENQELPDTLFGVVPKSIMWRFLKPFARNWGMRLINWAKYKAGSTLGNHKTYRQSHAGFAFLLDYVPNWKFVYKPGGLIQYQSFVPAENAERCFTAQLELCHAWGIIPYLGVFKRHKWDEFWMSHAVDGYSFALDFPVTARNRQRLWELAARLNEMVLENGGRFYFAKDSTLDGKSAAAYLGEERLRQFFALKRACDPENLLQTELSKRLFGDR
ncbi:MAG TPA: FAD-binding oxidoreductase [Chthonomonadaceae bacterium]|nr:FAD-binding oxidoreductase [Chthonomonadaceae bacterium]